MNSNKFYIEANIDVQEETPILKERASAVIELPKEGEKQPDLMYISAVLVSSGQNLNNAFFLGSELVAAEGSIVNKALDVEHSETEIIGSIISREFIDKDGKALSITELASKEKAGLDSQDMHIAISAIIYKNRFPALAQEIAEKKWSKVSMECYYQDYDIKVGNLIMARKEAEALGLTEKSNFVGKMAKVLKEGKEIASGTVARVLRGICFSGCGIVKHPANPASVIMEVAHEQSNDGIVSSEVIVLDYDKLNKDNNNLTLANIDTTTNPQETSADNDKQEDYGICINYKHKVFDKNNKLVSESYCSAYKKTCTSFSREATDPECLKVVELKAMIKDRMDKLHNKAKANDRRKELLKDVEAALGEAVKIISQK